jgi:hypothetical protein
MSCSGLRVPTDSTCGLSSIVNSSEPRRWASGRCDLLFWVVPAFFWVVPTCWSLTPVSRLFNEFNQSLTRGRVGDAVGWFCPDSLFGRIVPLELVRFSREAMPTVLSSHPPSGGFGDKLCCGCQAPPGRPHRVRQRGLLYCQTAGRLRRGEKRLQLQVVVTRAWCGPRGLHSGWKARMTGWGSRWGPQKLRLVPLMKFSCCCLPSMRLPFLGGEGEQWGLLLPTCGYQRGASWWVSDVRLSGS